MNVRKGPYFADVGDFGSAGSVDIDYINRLPKNIAGDHQRQFRLSPRARGGIDCVGAGTLLAAVEGVKYNGPWDVPDNVRKLNGVLRYSQGTATDGFTLSAMAYSNGWNSTDQVAQRAIDQGSIGRFGSLDPTDGGTSQPLLAVRQLGAFERVRAEQGQRLRRQLGAAAVQQFHLLSRRSRQWRPVQPDRRARSTASMPATPSMCASPASRRRPASDCRRAATISASACSRRCSARRSRPFAKTACREGNVGLWADTTARWTDWLRTTVGIREDYFAGRVVSDTPENSGNAQASMTSPKAGIVLGPWYKTEFYGNAGYGLHSNDIRGATITVDPIDKVTPQDRVPLLVRSKGAEIGIRTKAIDGLTSSLAVFVLDFDSELLFVGDAGTTEASRPSRRVGVEWTNQYKSLPWMRLDLDVAYTRARFTDFDPAGDCIPGAPAWSPAGGVTFGGETRLVRRIAGALFRAASADRGRQRSFAVVADLQCARGLQIRQWLAAAARRAQSVQRENQPDRILLSVAVAGRADRRRRRPACASGRAAGGAADAGGQVLSL